jgi:glycosylphosphatidylinositol transamidase (GPIT) subunit GPI8
MALITSALERERDLLQKEVLKFAGVEISTEMEQQLHAAKAEIAKLKQEKQRVEEDALVRARLCQDQIDAEQLKNHALQLQLEAVRDKMGAGIDDLKVQVCQEKQISNKNKKFF